MATLRSILSKFKSISRPSLLGGSSSAYSTLAKQTQAAEDASIDNSYASGDLSPEYYLSKLQERTGRSGVTPVQLVALNKKINDVQVAVNDAIMSNSYASGKATTQDMIDYEQKKLDAMTEPTSAAYIKQQQTVQGLQDKLTKETRASTIAAENLRISQMPEDSSANLWDKANLYKQLSDEARLNGDTATADTLLTQANNYTNSAGKADVNDMISGARLSVSQTPSAGTGVPSAEEGAKFYSSLTGGKPISGSATVGGGSQGTAPGSAPSTVTATTGFSGYQTPAVKNALTSLDSQQKTYNRLIAQKQDNQTMVAKYQDAVSKSTGDQKTSLQTSLNNLIDAGNGIDNQLANVTQNINDTVLRIQDLQQKAALSGFKQEVRTNNTQFDKAETDLETAFKKGQIGKEEYITKGYALAATKTQYLSQVSDVFNQYGDDTNAQSYLQKSTDTQNVVDSLANVGNNLDDYEPIAVEPGGKITNLFGKPLQPGDVALTDVRQLKDNGTFQRQYAARDGKFYKVHFPADITDANGDLLPAYVNQDLSKYNGTSYIYQTNDKGQVIGKNDPASQIQFATINDVQRPFTTDLFKKMQGYGAITQDNNGSWIQTPRSADPSLLLKVMAGVQGVVTNAFNGIKNFLTQPTPGAIQSKPWPTNPVQQVQGQLQSKPNANPNVSFQLPSLVSTVKAEGVPVKVPAQYQVMIADAAAKHGVSYDVLAALLDKESMHFNPDVINGNINSPAGAQGIAQFMPDTARQLGVNPLDPASAIDGSAKYLSQLTKQFNGDISKGLAAYNAGAGAVQKYGGIPPFTETINYVKDILGKVGGILSGKTTAISSPTKDYTNVSQMPTREQQTRNNNIALALGLQPGQYRTGLKTDQGAIDKAFRSDQATQDLMRSEGFKPSWETQSVSAPSQAIGNVATQPAKPNLIQNISSGIGNVSSGIGNVVRSVQNAVSNIKLPSINIPQYQPKLISPVPQPVQPNIIQRAVSSIQANPVVQNVGGFINNAVNKLKSIFHF